MNILKDLVRRMNTFTIFDYASYEIVVFTMGLLLAKLLPFLVQGNTWLYIVIIAIWATHMYDALYGKWTTPTTPKTPSPKKKTAKKTKTSTSAKKKISKKK